MLYDTDGVFNAGKAQVAQEAFRLNLLLLATALVMLVAAVLLAGLLSHQAGYAAKDLEQPVEAAQAVVARRLPSLAQTPVGDAGR